MNFSLAIWKDSPFVSRKYRVVWNCEEGETHVVIKLSNAAE